MGEGVTFYNGNDDPTRSESNTCGNEKLSGGGPVDFYKGSEEHGSTKDTSNYTAKKLSDSTPGSGSLGSQWVSPTDR